MRSLRVEPDVAQYRRVEAELWSSVGLVPTERRVRLACTGTSVRVQDVGSGDPVLLLHGELDAGATWAPLVGHLPGVRCLVIDRPGAGLSAPYPITATNLPRIASAFVADLLDGLGLCSAHVVASSFGGHLALRSAAATPHRFRRMVQLGCPAFVTRPPAPALLRLLTRSWARTTLTALPPGPRAVRVLMRQLGHGNSLGREGLAPAVLDYYLALLRHTDTRRHDGELIAELVAGQARITLDDTVLAAVDVPTLWLWGADDTLAGPDVARRVANAMPDATLRVVVGAGHLPWLDDPEGMATAALDFLNAADVRS